MGRPRKSIDIIKVCENCKTEFPVKEWEARRRDRKYCSPHCRAEHLTTFVDEKFFDEPNTQMAYILGLIVTDGCIVKRKSSREFVSIKSIDRQVLEKVKEMMRSEYGIYECGLSDAGNMVYRVDFASDKIVAGVKKWGVTARKTFTAVFPNLPKEFHADFVRGVFDGDGGVYVYEYPDQIHTQLCILGTKKLLKGVVAASSLDAEIKPNKKIFKVVCYAWDKLKSFHDFIYYADDIPCLMRKKLDFQKALTLGSKENRQARNATRNGETHV